MSKILVVGATATRKSPIAEELEARKGYTHIRASKLFRDEYEASHDTSKHDRHRGELKGVQFVRSISDYCKGRLQEDPYVNIRHVKAQMCDGDNFVIEGIRNPLEFHNWFNPLEDIVVHVRSDQAPNITTIFEKGVEVIMDCVDWYRELGIIKPWQHKHVSFHQGGMYVGCVGAGISLSYNPVEEILRDRTTPQYDELSQRLVDELTRQT